MKGKVLTFILLFLIASSSIHAVDSDPGIKLEDFNPTLSVSPVVPTSPAGSSRLPPPERDTTTGVCTSGGPGVVVAALFTYYRRQGLSVTEAQNLAERRLREYSEAANRVFAGQPCVETVVKALVRVSLSRGIDFYELLNQVSTMSTAEIMATFPKESSTPLFLWAPTETLVRIYSQKLVSWSNPQAHENSWEVVASSTGKILERMTGNSYEAISYGLVQPFPPSPPDDQIIIRREDLSSLLKKIIIAGALPNEYQDSALMSWLTRIPTAPFYSLGVYDEGEVEQVLSLSVTPIPENLGKLVLFVKPLLRATPTTNSFPAVPHLPSRQGLTVYDVGLVVEW